MMLHHNLPNSHHFYNHHQFMSFILRFSIKSPSSTKVHKKKERKHRFRYLLKLQLPSKRNFNFLCVCFVAKAYRMLTWHFKSFRMGVALHLLSIVLFVVVCKYMRKRVREEEAVQWMTFFMRLEIFFFFNLQAVWGVCKWWDSSRRGSQSDYILDYTLEYDLQSFIKPLEALKLQFKIDNIYARPSKNKV